MVGSYRIEYSNHHYRDSPLIRADGFKAHLVLRPLFNTGDSNFPYFFSVFKADGRAQKTRRRWGTPPGNLKYVRLFWYYVRGLRTFFSIGLFELDFLALFQCFESLRLNFREVNEHVLSIFRLNKAIPFAFVEPLYFTVRHTNRAPQIEREGVRDRAEVAFPSCLSGDYWPHPRKDPAWAPLSGLP